MIILGISPLDKDATVTLLVDGKPVYAIAEERLSRRKMHAGFPGRAIELVLARVGIRPQEIDRVAYAFFDWRRETELMYENLRSDRRRPAEFSLWKGPASSDDDVSG